MDKESSISTSPEMSLSDNESMDDEDDVMTQAQINALDEKIQSSPFDYQAHVDRIALLRQCGEFEKLNQARENMSVKFPLTQELWLHWLEDEQKFAESEEDHEKLESLFERATKDYLSPEIWLEYAQYSIRLIGQEDGIAKLRRLMERALSAVGLHVSKGSLVWEAYREIENAILTTMQPQPGSISSPEENDRINQQMERVGSLFHRQLAIPLLDLATTMKEYQEWRVSSEDGELPTSVLQSYDESKKKMEELTKFESALDQENESKLDEYLAYIDFEKKSADPARVQCIYERAVADNCLNSELWLQYLAYLAETLKSGPIVVSVHERAVRNCPWTSQLWQKYLICLERDNATVEELEKVRNNAFDVGFSSAADYALLWQTCCDQARRYYCAGKEDEKDKLSKFLRSTFESATDHLANTVATAFNEIGDPECTLWCYWARCEAAHLKDMNKARQVLNLLLQDVNVRRMWSVWLEYFHLERLYGDVEHARSVLYQAVQATAADDGSAESACFYLLRFEREHGTLVSLDDAARKTEARLAKVAKRKEKTAALSQATSKRREPRERGDKQWKGAKTSKVSNKRHDNARDYSEVPAKRQKMEPTRSPEAPAQFKAPTGLPVRFVKKKTNTDKVEQISESKQITAPPGYKPGGDNRQAKSTSKSHVKDNETVATHGKTGQDEKMEDAPHSEEGTVFVSNLAYETENAEEKLEKIFGACGSLKEVRVVRNNKGKLRGFAYVQFTDKSSVEKALKLDRQPLNGRPMFVSPNADKTNKQDFKAFRYEAGMERHKLFISGLSFDTQEDRLTEIFSAYGKLRSVRIVTMRSGKSKGLAYVEYESQSDAAQAVMKADGTVVDDFTITVAISNPPARKKPTDDRSLTTPHRTTIIGGRGRGRTQLSLVPRALQRADTKPAASTNEAEASAGKALSNKDFAQLFAKR